MRGSIRWHRDNSIIKSVDPSRGFGDPNIQLNHKINKIKTKLNPDIH